MKSIGTLTGPWRTYWATIILVWGSGVLVGVAPDGSWYWRAGLSLGLVAATWHVARSWWRAHVFSIF